MKKYWGILVILLLSFWAIKPFFQAGFFPVHDDTQVARVAQMAQALKDGQFPVRWVANLGYGFSYPIFNFYAPLAYYVGASFSLLGFNALAATKIMFILGVVLSGISMYFLAREFWREIGGIVSALFYIYAPYHALDIYVRGAVGELWAMAFLPLVFLGLWRIYKNRKSGIIIGGLGSAAVILSHNLTALMVLPFILPLALVLFFLSQNKKLFTFNFLLLTFYALGISAFYWLPALAEMNLTKVFGQIGAGADFRDHFVYLDQLWASPWGFGGSAPGRLDGMSFMVGKLHLLVVFISLFLVARKKLLIFPLIAFTLAAFLTTPYSRPIWEAFPLLAFVQYPWRFLTLAILAVSFAAGGVIVVLKKFTLPVSGFLLLALLFLNLKYFQPQSFNGLTSAQYLAEEKIKWETSKISDEYLPKDFPVPTSRNDVAWEKLAILSGEAKVEKAVFKSQEYNFNLKAQTPAEVLVNTAYFPGWKVWVNQKEITPTIADGKIRLSFAPGDYTVVLKFTNTPVRTLANLISLVSLLVLLKYSRGRRD